MPREWRVEPATLAAPQPQWEPRQLIDVLKDLEGGGWTIHTILSEPAISEQSVNRARVIAYREL